MQEYCHRCGEELAGDTQFCAHCGAPQLTLAVEQQTQDANAEALNNAASTGAMPPPRPSAAGSVDWQVAIRYALGVATVGALLGLAAIKVDALSLPSLLWTVSGSMITLGLYQKRLPAARIDAGIGARIGLLVGLCLALGLATSMAGWGLVERYVMHGLGQFDAQMTAETARRLKQMLQQAAAQQEPVPPWLPGLLTSPEARAGAMLAVYAAMTAGLMVISAVGGAFGGLLRMRRR